MSCAGVVKFFNFSKGYGFITTDRGDVFVHANDVTGNPLNEGDEVVFDEVFDEMKQKMRAAGVQGGTGSFQQKGFKGGFGGGKGKGGKGFGGFDGFNDYDGGFYGGGKFGGGFGKKGGYGYDDFGGGFGKKGGFDGPPMW